MYEQRKQNLTLYAVYVFLEYVSFILYLIIFNYITDIQNEFNKEIFYLIYLLKYFTKKKLCKNVYTNQDIISRHKRR